MSKQLWNEFSAGERIALELSYLNSVPAEDYPQARSKYERALEDFINAMRDNGRFEKGNKYQLKAA